MERYVADGNDAVEFKLVRSADDLENSILSFKPEMCHQIFGEGETIFGYEDLKIKLYFSAGSLKSYVGIFFKNKISPSQCDGVEADNITSKLLNVIPPGYFENLNDFTIALSKEKTFRPYGELIHCFHKTPGSTLSNKKNMSNSNGFNGGEKTYEVYHCSTTISKFGNYLRSMETFIMFFIDAASFVDPDDEKWNFFVLYEKYKNPEGEYSYVFVGYASVYNFYCFPEHIRPRIGQMLLLPPFQKQGLAIELLSCIYRTYRSDNKVTEITVEDPSDEFEVLRDYVDVLDCMKLPTYQFENVRKGYSLDMQNEARTQLKMTKRQSRRIYEILRLRTTDVQNQDEFKNFRLEVKRRLNIPYQKQEADLKRLQRRNLQSDVLEKTAMLDDASRKAELESNFQNAYEHYKNILKRLEKYSPI